MHTGVSSEEEGRLMAINQRAPRSHLHMQAGEGTHTERKGPAFGRQIYRHLPLTVAQPSISHTVPINMGTLSVLHHTPSEALSVRGMRLRPSTYAAEIVEFATIPQSAPGYYVLVDQQATVQPWGSSLAGQSVIQVPHSLQTAANNPSRPILLPHPAAAQHVPLGGAFIPTVYPGTNGFGIVSNVADGTLQSLEPPRVQSSVADLYRNAFVQSCASNGIEVRDSSRCRNTEASVSLTEQKRTPITASMLGSGLVGSSNHHTVATAYSINGQCGRHPVSNSAHQQTVSRPYGSVSDRAQTTPEKERHETFQRKEPRRPLSAYNLYFKDERAKMLGLKELPSSNLHELDLPKQRRKHRKTHGKVGFTEMARVIADRWKQADDSTRFFYENLGKKELKRYKAAMKGLKDAQGKP